MVGCGPVCQLDAQRAAHGAAGYRHDGDRRLHAQRCHQRHRAGEESRRATVFLPTSDEWYKAAYYSPTKNGTGGYYTYAMQSDTNPGNVVGSNANQANFKSGGGTIYSVTQSSSFDSNQNYLTDAGAFTNSASYYGTFDQNGNVSEWSSPIAPASNIANWGGSWRWGIVDLMKGSPSSAAPDYRDEGFGFRLAAVPEPSTWAMALAGLACGGWMLRRQKPAGGPRQPSRS